MVKNDPQFNNFKIHTQYSICEGAIKIDDLSSYCKTNKIKSAGICDSYNLCGALEFAEKISKSGTQPIIGSQINFIIDGVIGKLPIFATNEVGYKNLTKLSSKSYLDGNSTLEPHCKIDDLCQENFINSFW
jgi:DNA polymerase-3 subunit alpha